jgi:tetratricopeptide (TPR) repeat protein
MFRTFIVLVGGLASLWTVSSQAQQAVLGQLFDQGVHAYYSYDYAQAYERLTTAISAGSRDPRVYYFRGLSYLKLGHRAEAELDFRKGAELESKDINKFYDVGRALERIQGSERQLLESYRVQARMAAFKESEKLRKARYEAIKREEARVLQQQVDQASTKPAGQSAETIPAPAGEAAGVKEAQSADANPFGDSSQEKKAPGAEPTGEDPFSSKTALEKPAAADEKPTTQSIPTNKKSIFGALGKSLTKALTSGNKEPAPNVKP